MPAAGIEAEARAERNALHRRIGRRGQRRDERASRVPGEIAPPAVQLRRLGGGQAEDGDPAHSLGVADAAADSHDRHRLRPSRERGIARERGSVEHRDERLQILANDDVERDGERRLIALGLDERGAIPLGEQRQREREREEGDGYGGRARAAAERHGRETRADAAVEQPPSQPDQRAEETRRGDSGGKRDQAREEEQHQPAFWLPASRDWSAAPPSSAAMTRAIEPDRGDVQQPEAALGAGRHRGGNGDDQRRQHDDARRDREPGR